jgi:hypothetical protein
MRIDKGKLFASFSVLNLGEELYLRGVKTRDFSVIIRIRRVETGYMITLYKGFLHKPIWITYPPYSDVVATFDGLITGIEGIAYKPYTVLSAENVVFEPSQPQVRKPTPEEALSSEVKEVE